MSTRLGTRLANGLRRRRDAWRHRGSAVHCPVCERDFSTFQDDWNRPNALCWRCGSQERHRALWLFLSRHPQLFSDVTSLLHFAPEWGVSRRIRQLRDSSGPDFNYVTADLEAPGVDLHVDMTDMSVLTDGAFDAVICSHVLEHIPDDGAAMRELARVTRPGGWCLVMVPLDVNAEATYEDPTITSPEARTAAFWQHDHVRVYAPDIQRRLEAAGFTVDALAPDDLFTADEMRRNALLSSDIIWLGRR